MRAAGVLGFALQALLCASSISASVLLPRAEETCSDLSAQSNNGDRKVAIVIDSSGSMAASDPTDLRLVAGRILNDWLIANNEARGGKKADLVTVIDFASTASLDFPLGDPGMANSSFDQIGADGGTWIASGVSMAISQLTQGNTGNTESRSGIIVFTDGQDGDVQGLVTQINRAISLGIRVSFGFLDKGSALQDTRVLASIVRSGGVYSTVFTEASSRNFIKLVIVNGITRNDNPGGTSDILLAGLSTTHFISGSETQTIKYFARNNENITFAVQNLNSTALAVDFAFGNNLLKNITVPNFTTRSTIVSSPGQGRLDIRVKANNAGPNSIFAISANSNLPVQNCTINVDGKELSPGAKAGISISVLILLGLLGLGGWLTFKYVPAVKKIIPAKWLPGNHAPPTAPPEAPTQPPGDLKYPLTPDTYSVPASPPGVPPMQQPSYFPPPTQYHYPVVPPPPVSSVPPKQKPYDPTEKDPREYELHNPAQPTNNGNFLPQQPPNNGNFLPQQPPQSYQPPMQDFPPAQDPPPTEQQPPQSQQPNELPDHDYDHDHDKDKRKKRRKWKRSILSLRHHHHRNQKILSLDWTCPRHKTEDGSQPCTCEQLTCELANPNHTCAHDPHPCICSSPTCPLNAPDHKCEFVRGQSTEKAGTETDYPCPCLCVDKRKCPLADLDHDCDDEACPCNCTDPDCQWTDSQYREDLDEHYKDTRRKELAKELAKGNVDKAIGHVVGLTGAAAREQKRD